MEINKIKLFNGGRAGMEVKLIESVRMKVKDYILKDKVDRKRGIPIPPDLKMKIYSLRYFYFNLTGHWSPPFNKYIDDSLVKLKEHNENEELTNGEEFLRALWNGTEIEEIEMRGSLYRIKARIYTLMDKSITVATPWVEPDDDYNFYDELSHIIFDICEGVIKYLTSDTLSLAEANILLKELMSSQTERERVDKQSDKENLEELARILEKGGYICFKDDVKAIGDGKEEKEETSVRESKQTINSDMYEGATTEDDKETSEELVDDNETF